LTYSTCTISVSRIADYELTIWFYTIEISMTTDNTDLLNNLPPGTAVIDLEFLIDAYSL